MRLRLEARGVELDMMGQPQRGNQKKPWRFSLIGRCILLLATIIPLAELSTAQQQQQQQQPHTQNSNDSAAQANQTNTKPNYLETGRQITGILDRFMSLGYDKRVRPNYGGPPVEVNVTMRILSISSVSEVMMDFTADFYFRQTWHDPRLSFKKLGDIQTLYVGAEVSKKIWLPDTFFGNEKMAYFHEATTPNVFLRIDHSGEVYRSIRLTVTSSCPMNLQYFPMDRQRCTIEAESYGYNVKDIIYRWARKETAVERDKEISLPQFDIVKTVQKYRLEELSSGTYSRLIAEIHFARRMGYYLIQIYIPSSLIVVISWVSFWLHRNASPARVQLGVTTVLTMTTLMSSTNAALPKISYVKSIDIFLGTCFIMVFAALLEYATVGYLGKRIAMRKSQAQHAQSQSQARIFAQLQAQGAKGEPIPLSGASLGSAQPEPSPLGLSHLFGQVSSSALQQQRAPGQALLHPELSELPETLAPLVPLPPRPRSATPPPVPDRSGRGCQQCSSLLGLTGEPLGCVHRHPCCCQATSVTQGAKSVSDLSSVLQQCGSCCQLSGQIFTDQNNLHHHGCQGNHQYHRHQRYHNHQQHHHQHQYQQQQHHDHYNNTHHHHHHHHHHRQHQNFHSNDQLPPNTFISATAAAAASMGPNFAQTLPRNISFAGQAQNLAPSAPDKFQAAEHSPSSFNNNQSHNQHIQFEASPILSPMPPSYCATGKPGGTGGGASAAAAAAAATFVNMHRRNKGLPPSNNPAFAQFAWMGKQNRSLETIFGVRPSDIDKYSRVVFPVCFVCFQLMYWIVYLHISAFLDTEQQQPKV